MTLHIVKRPERTPGTKRVVVTNLTDTTICYTSHLTDDEIAGVLSQAQRTGIWSVEVEGAPMSAPDLDGLKTVLVDALSDISVLSYNKAAREAQGADLPEIDLITEAHKLALTIHEKVAAPLLERIAELENQLNKSEALNGRRMEQHD